MEETKLAIQKKIVDELRGTPYEPRQLEPLSGGAANFTFHAVLKTHLPEGTNEVVIKHAEPYVATNPSFGLSVARVVRSSFLPQEQLKPLQESRLTDGKSVWNKHASAM
jgi:hypothetical protein